MMPKDMVKPYGRAFLSGESAELEESQIIVDTVDDEATSAGMVQQAERIQRLLSPIQDMELVVNRGAGQGLEDIKGEIWLIIRIGRK